MEVPPPPPPPGQLNRIKLFLSLNGKTSQENEETCTSCSQMFRLAYKSSSESAKRHRAPCLEAQWRSEASDFEKVYQMFNARAQCNEIQIWTCTEHL